MKEDIGNIIPEINKLIKDNNLENYILSPVNPYNPESIVINTENNLINIYYVSKSNITNQKVTKNTNDIITSTSDIVNYNINYTANIKNAIGINKNNQKVLTK